MYNAGMEKENTAPSTSFRYLMVFYIGLAIYFAVLLFLGIPKLKENLEAVRWAEHYQLWKSKESIQQEVLVTVYLHTYQGDTVVNRTIYIGRKDALHYTLEALLQPLNTEELKNGFVSWIPEGTKLEGAALSEGYCFVRLSTEFLQAEDMDSALEQMKKTLCIAFNAESLVVICGSECFTR